MFYDRLSRIFPTEWAVVTATSIYDENNSNRMTRFELDKAEDGTITIVRETSGYTKAPSGIFGNGEKTTSFDNQTTDIVIPPASKEISIRFCGHSFKP